MPGAPGWIQQGLDDIFLSACDTHDECWRQCNGPAPPYLGLSHRNQCDAQFLADTETACLAWSAVIAFPLDDLDNATEFLAHCSAAALVMYAAVQTPWGTDLFWTNQCMWGCNPPACDNAGMEETFLSLCGTGFGPGQCFVVGNYDPCVHFPFLTWCDTCFYAPEIPQCQEECILNPATCPPTPIVLDLAGDGIRLSGPRPPVAFDLDADGAPDLTSWTRRAHDEAFLVLDRNENGVVDDGSEMFGTAVELIDGSLAAHGYQALAELDGWQLGGNQNGQIDPGDAAFPSLRLWLDANRNGETDTGELLMLRDVGLVAIDLSFEFSPLVDHWGNGLNLWSVAHFAGGQQCRAVDVFFKKFNDSVLPGN